MLDPTRNQNMVRHNSYGVHQSYLLFASVKLDFSKVIAVVLHVVPSLEKEKREIKFCGS